MAQLNCCICMLPLTANAAPEITDFDAEDFYDFDENDQGFEDYVEERSRSGFENVYSSSTSTNNIFFDAISPSGSSSTGQQEQPLSMQPVAIKATSCGHLYHAECLRLWLSTLELEGRAKVCAFCRKPLKRRTSIITIYPVSLTETEDDKRNELEANSSNINIQKSKAIPDDDPTSSTTRDEKPNLKQYFDKQFFYTLLISIIHFVTFMNYIHNCTLNFEEEKIEEDDFIPFGAGWAIMTTLVCIISCTLDCYPVLWHLFPA